MNVSDISFSWENSDWTYVDSQQTMLQIRDAVVEDLRSGNVQLYSLLTGTEDTIGSLDINGWTSGEGDNQNWFYYSYYIPSTATATIAALSQLEAEEIAPGASSAEQTSADYTITEYGTEAKEGDTVLLQWSNAVLQLSNTDSATGRVCSTQPCAAITKRWRPNMTPIWKMPTAVLKPWPPTAIQRHF